MHIAPPTLDEAQCLALLRSLDLLDSAPEPAFDALTRLTSQLLGVPIALVSLVDEQRQWFKSRSGLEATETPRDLAFCAHAIHHDGPFVVPDATLDARFHDNPLVTGAPQVRAYAGIPLRSQNGHAMGTLCAIDHKPRDFSPQELKLLEDFATVARREILHREAAMHARKVADENLRVVSDSEQLYSATFDRAAIGIAIVGLDGSWQKLNAKMADIMGRTPDDLMRMTFQDVTHPDDLDIDLGLLHELLAGSHDHYTLEKRYLRPDGGLVWAHLTVTLVRLNGEPHHFISVVEDITARKQAEQALQQLHRELEQRVNERTAELQRTNDMLQDVVAQRRASERHLAEASASLQDLYDHAPCAYYSLDAQGKFVKLNQVMRTWLGCTNEEAIGKMGSADFFDAADRLRFRAVFDEFLRKGRIGPLEFRLRSSDGVVRHVNVSATAVFDEQGRFVHSRTVMNDITENVQIKHALQRLNREQSLMLDNDLIAIAKLRDRRVVWHNRALERMFGFGPGEMDQLPTRQLYLDDARYEGVGAVYAAALREHGSYRAQLQMRHRSGQPIWVDASGATLATDAGEVGEAGDAGESLWLLQDITVMKLHQQQVERMAFHDALTGLPNRLLLADRLHQAMAVSARQGSVLAVCFIDLDGFKAVNDRLGHDAGDKLLQIVAARLQESLRAHDTVARLGGDEFVVVLSQLHQREECTSVVDRLLSAIGAPIALDDGQQAAVSASIGVAFHPEDGQDTASLLAAADEAMYQAKQAGRNRVRWVS